VSIETRAPVSLPRAISYASCLGCGRTATVLQPGRYKLVRSGQSASGSSAKYLQIIEITGRARTG
jgi:hypothetical protein